MLGIRVRARAGVLVAALFAASASGAAAQSAIYGAGLQAWLGCWSAELSAPSIVCITPTASVNVAEVLTLQDGRIVGRETLDATGRPHAIDAARCTGTRSARWSRDGRRLFVRSSGSCAGVPSSSAGLLVMSAEGDWLDVESISAGGGASVRVAHYREVVPPASLPASARSALRAQALATRSVRVAAGAPVRAEDVLEAVRLIDSAVVEAWILERAQRFEITEAELASLVTDGIPTHVADALGAAAEPQAYTLARSEGYAYEPANMSSDDEWYDLPLGWGCCWGTSFPFGNRFGGRFRDARRFGYYRPPIGIVRGHDGRPRGRGTQGHGGNPRGGGDGRGGTPPQSGASTRPAGDPRGAPASQPAGATFRLGKPRG